MLEMEILYNRQWDFIVNPRVSVITPVYNRRLELPRALLSLEVQTNLNVEHIIINDGSVESLDDIMSAYMERVKYPVAYIKKRNGGVHTARNAGIQISRGEMMAFLDSDDEFLPVFIQTFLDAWDSIPEERRGEYRECNAFCMDQNKMRIGRHLPLNINDIPYSKATAIVNKAKQGEKVGFYRADLMRSNPWPEPEGVKVVAEDVIWYTLGAEYKTWFLDDVLRVYHTESDNSITRAGIKEQTIINCLYNSLWYVNNGRQYNIPKKVVIFNAFVYATFRHLLRWKFTYPKYDWARKGVEPVSGKLLQVLMWAPSVVAAVIYSYTRKM